jgi:hypothetical protein
MRDDMYTTSAATFSRCWRRRTQVCTCRTVKAVVGARATTTTTIAAAAAGVGCVDIDEAPCTGDQQSTRDDIPACSVLMRARAAARNVQTSPEDNRSQHAEGRAKAHRSNRGRPLCGTNEEAGVRSGHAVQSGRRAGVVPHGAVQRAAVHTEVGHVYFAGPQRLWRVGQIRLWVFTEAAVVAAGLPGSVGGWPEGEVRGLRAWLGEFRDAGRLAS